MLTRGLDRVSQPGTGARKYDGFSRAQVRSSFARAPSRPVKSQSYRPSSCRRLVCASSAGDAAGSIRREVLQRPERMKLDTGDDREFYSFPRFVTHVDDVFLAQVTQLYRDLIPEGGVVLDLCSSWVSHLPPDVKYSKVIGHGMNAAELARNERLDSFFVRNLNTEPSGWAIQDNSLDAVLCCVSVQYMQRPEAVFAEIQRTLKPGGVCIITFSSRMFYSKAIAAWRDAPTGYARVQLVKSYFQAVDGFTQPAAVTQVPLPNRPEPLSSKLLPGLSQLAKLFERSASDPFYAVVARKVDVSQSS